MINPYKCLEQLVKDLTNEGRFDTFSDEQMEIVIGCMNIASDAGQNKVFREWDVKPKGDN